MEDSPRSPKRRRILSSYNPPDLEAENSSFSKRRHRALPIPRDKSTPPRDTAPPTEKHYNHAEERKDPANDDGPEPTDKPTVKATKFRFKSEKSFRSRSHDRDRDDDGHRRRRSRRGRSISTSPSKDGQWRPRSRSRSRDRRRRHSSKDCSSRSHRHHRHHHRSRRKRASPAKESPAPDPFAPDDLDPETAFRESLFDAMADDEGAAYWEGIYGQPIHIYSRPTPSSSAGGHLEIMTDEEYATYVRQKMWEKTHAGLLEAKARRDKERAEAKLREEEARRITKEMEKSLQKGEERRRRRMWRHKWEEYLQKWREWDGTATDKNFPWPVNVDPDEMDLQPVRAFFVDGLNLEELGEKEFAARLKEERVRWHPDKIQQRLLGGAGAEGKEVDKQVMKGVTAVFQAVDQLWGEMRKSVS